MRKLPLDQDALVNFVLNHIHAWSEEFMELNPDYDYVFEDVMDEDYQSFVGLLDQEYRRAMARFKEAARWLSGI